MCVWGGGGGGGGDRGVGGLFNFVGLRLGLQVLPNAVDLAYLLEYIRPPILYSIYEILYLTFKFTAIQR